MKRWKNLLLVMVIGFTGCGGGGENGEDKEITGPENSTENETGLEVKPGDNAEITAANVHIIWSHVYTIVDSLPWRWMSAGARNTLIGNNSGEVTITKSNRSDLENISFIFKNYSEDGETWVEGFFTFARGSSEQWSGKWFYGGQLSVAGEYKGVLHIDRVEVDHDNYYLVPTTARGTINGFTVNLRKKTDGWVPI